MILPPEGDSILVLLLNSACVRACVCVCLSICVRMHVCCKFVSDNWVYAQLEVCYVYEILTHSCTFCQHIYPHSLLCIYLGYIIIYVV